MRIAVILAAFALVACGGGSSGGPTEAPVRITSSGFVNASITIPSGGRVHFFNNDSVAHQVTSSDCPQLDTPSIPAGGDSLQATMTGPASCNYKDAANASLVGSVTVSAPGTGGGGAGY
jgi:plastocyanin